MNLFAISWYVTEWLKYQLQRLREWWEYDPAIDCDCPRCKFLAAEEMAVTEQEMWKASLNSRYGKYAMDVRSAYPKELAEEWTMGGVTNVRLSDSKTVHISELVPLKCVIADEITGKIIELEQDEMRNLRSA